MREGQEVLARTLWGEARGGDGSPGFDDNIRGMEAVACVVMNRIAVAKAHGGWYWWGGTVQDVCRKPRQFSCWNADDPNKAKMEAVTEADPAYAAALRIAGRAVAGALADVTRGATHYHAEGVSPKWALAMELRAIVGRHRFYREGEASK